MVSPSRHRASSNGRDRASSRSRVPRSAAGWLVLVSPLFGTLAPAWAAGSDSRGREGGGYVGIFGGAALSSRTRTAQTGTAHRRGEWRVEGLRDFDLPVAVNGTSRRHVGSAIGAHLGYEFVPSRTRIRPAIEVEYGRYGIGQHADLTNPVTEQAAAIGTDAANAGLADPGRFVSDHYAAGEHRFANRMRLDVHTIMLNGIVSLDAGRGIRPYLGAGVGVAIGAARKAISLQTNPSGPIEVTSDTHETVNHFNSRDRDTALSFAMLGKAGIRVPISGTLSAFAEYRLTRVASMRFDFGSTQYSGHPPTDPWTVRQGPMLLHSGLLGLRLGF